MDSSSAMHPFVDPEYHVVDTSGWLTGSADLMDDLRLPKRRRYLGEDMSRHSWDNRGTMSTEPPTPVFLEQQELVDENVNHNDVVPIMRH